MRGADNHTYMNRLSNAIVQYIKQMTDRWNYNYVQQKAS